MNYVPTNPDTGRPYTLEEAALNTARFSCLRNIMADQEHPRRREILQCAQASAHEGDSTPSLRKWGGIIERMLQDEVEEMVKQERAAGAQFPEESAA